MHKNNQDKSNNIKLRYRLHKSGKFWITTTLATAFMGIGMHQTVHADTTNSNKSTTATVQSNANTKSGTDQSDTPTSGMDSAQTNVSASTSTENSSVANTAISSTANSTASMSIVNNSTNTSLSTLSSYYDQYDKAHQVSTNKVAIQAPLKLNNGKIINSKSTGLPIQKIKQTNGNTTLTTKINNEKVIVNTKNTNVKPLYYTHGELSKNLPGTVNFHVLAKRNINAYDTAKTKGHHVKINANSKLLIKRMVVYHQIPKFQLSTGKYITANRFYIDLIQNPVIMNSNQNVTSSVASSNPTQSDRTITSSNSTTSSSSNNNALSAWANNVSMQYQGVPTPQNNTTTTMTPTSNSVDYHQFSNFQTPSRVSSITYVSSDTADSLMGSTAQSVKASMEASYAINSSSAQSAYSATMQVNLQSITDSLTSSYRYSTQQTADSLNTSASATINSKIQQIDMLQSLVNSYKNNAQITATSYTNQINDLNIRLAASYATTSTTAKSNYDSQVNSLNSLYALNLSNAQGNYNNNLSALQSSYNSASTTASTNAANDKSNAIQSLQSSYVTASTQTSIAYQQSLSNLQATLSAANNNQDASLANSTAIANAAITNSATSVISSLITSAKAQANALNVSASNQATSLADSANRELNSQADSLKTSLTHVANSQAGSLTSSANSAITSAQASVTASLSASYNSMAQSMTASYATAISNAVSSAQAGETQMAHSNTVTDFSLDQARYNPGQTVNLQYTLTNQADEPSANNITVKIYNQDQVVASIDKKPFVDSNQSQTFNLQWTAPNQDYTGYWMAIEVDGKIQKVGAIDVSSDINKFPRYGAVTKFTPGTDNSAIIQQMKQWNMNVLEYYDAYQNPQTPIDYDDPSADYKQTWAPWLSDADKTKSGQVVMNTVSDAHKNGIDSMFYNMIYAITGNANDKNYLASLGVKPEWLLYHADGDQKDQLFQFPMAGYMSDHTSPDYLNAIQTYLDIENPEVIDWIVSRMRPVLEKMNFDGWHGDTIGNNDLMYSKNADGSINHEYRIGDQLGNFANAVKQRLTNKKFVVNTVSGYGEDNVAKSNADFDYSETWTGTYNDVVSEIKRVTAESGKSLVIPGYLQEQLSKDHPNSNFNPNAVLLFDAMVYGAGGSRMEVVDGQHLLVGEFFPSKALNVTDDLKTQMNNYQTFITAYENLLRDGQSDNYHGVELYDNNGNSIARSDNASPNTVYAYGRSSNNSETIQLINMLGVTSDKWQDDDSSRQQPTEIDHFHVHYYPSQKYQPGNSNEAHHVYLASPDGTNANQSIEVPFTWKTNQYGYYMDITVPSLQRWDMLYLK